MNFVKPMRGARQPRAARRAPRIVLGPKSRKISRKMAQNCPRLTLLWSSFPTQSLRVLRHFAGSAVVSNGINRFAAGHVKSGRDERCGQRSSRIKFLDVIANSTTTIITVIQSSSVFLSVRGRMMRGSHVLQMPPLARQFESGLRSHGQNLFSLHSQNIFLESQNE